MSLKKISLIIDANVYRDKGIINVQDYEFSEFCETLFGYFQDKVLELCEKHPEIEEEKLIAILNQMIINDKQKN